MGQEEQNHQTSVTFEHLQELVDFARENGLTMLAVGGVSFDLAPIELIKNAQQQVERHMTEEQRKKLRDELKAERKRRGRPKNLAYWSAPDPIVKE